MTGSMRGSDDGRVTFAESNTTFTEGIFQMIVSELPALSWRILSYRKKYWEWIPAVIDVEVAVSSANSFSSLETLDVKLCIEVGGSSQALSEDWKTSAGGIRCFHSRLSHSSIRVKTKSWGAISSSRQNVHEDRVMVRVRVRFLWWLNSWLTNSNFVDGNVSNRTN